MWNKMMSENIMCFSGQQKDFLHWYEIKKKKLDSASQLPTFDLRHFISIYL